MVGFASGYTEAIDTFIFDVSAKILYHHVVVVYSDGTDMAAVDDTDAPTGSGAVHDGWANHSQL